MNHLENLAAKLVGLDLVEEQLNQLRAAGKKIVFTNGCFDILHKGHVTYLAHAANLGDVLVLGLNTDDSVRRQGKGPERPVNNLEARKIVMAALGFIDFVVPFDEDTPEKLIQQLVPDVLVKGGDYDPEEVDPNSKKYIVGRETVLNNGGSVKTIQLVDGFSTTGIIQKLKK